jgi:hypothetical protein
VSRLHFLGERIAIGGRPYVVRALLPNTNGLTVESMDGFTTDVDASVVDDEPPSFRRVQPPTSKPESR